VIPLVEDYLSELIQSKLGYLKANPEYVGSVLSTSETRLAKLRAYLQSTPIKVIKGYPRTPNELPCVCILLSNEEESQIGLGDYIDDEDADIRQHTAEGEVVFRADGDMGAPYTRVPNVPLVGVYQVVNKTKGFVLDPDGYYVANESQGLIAFTTDEVEDEDIVEITFDYRHTAKVHMETLYEVNYRLECWSQNGDLTVDLYHLVKWSLLSGRDGLDGKGLFRQKLGGTDFEPATSYFPEFVYRRALTFWCQIAPSVPIEDITYVGGVEVNQSVSFDTGGRTDD
jgi:hypothetical protein